MGNYIILPSSSDSPKALSYSSLILEAYHVPPTPSFMSACS